MSYPWTVPEPITRVEAVRHREDDSRRKGGGEFRFEKNREEKTDNKRNITRGRATTVRRLPRLLLWIGRGASEVHDQRRRGRREHYPNDQFARERRGRRGHRCPSGDELRGFNRENALREEGKKAAEVHGRARLKGEGEPADELDHDLAVDVEGHVMEREGTAGMGTKGGRLEKREPSPARLRTL